LRIEKERQRAADRVQQLQAHLAAMRVEQDSIKRRLQERLAAQEKAAADKAKELAALRRAGAQLALISSFVFGVTASHLSMRVVNCWRQQLLQSLHTSYVAE
jgi:hypothetical protein